MEQLKNGQRIVFTIKDKNYRYEVCTNYLQKLGGGYNDEIFSDLKLDKIKLANSAYGYDSDGGDWPSSKFKDFVALTRLVEALFPYCDEVTVNGNIVYSKSEILFLKNQNLLFLLLNQNLLILLILNLLYKLQKLNLHLYENNSF